MASVTTPIPTPPRFQDYALDAAVYDEMFLPDGDPRAHCQRLYRTLTDLADDELSGIQERVTRSFYNEGITFTVYGDEEAEERIIPIDCIPRLLPKAEWDFLDAGLTQRLRTLNLFLQDVYGESRIVADGVIPAEVVYECPHYRPEMRGFTPPRGVWVAVCGTDVVRTNDGFRVLEDNLRVPSGVSYMIANRKATKASLRRLYRESRVQEVEQYGRMLQQTLHELGARRPGEPQNRPAHPRRVQLRLLRAYVPVPRNRRRVGGGPGLARPRRFRVYAHHHRLAAHRRHLPPG